MGKTQLLLRQTFPQIFLDPQMVGQLFLPILNRTLNLIMNKFKSMLGPNFFYPMEQLLLLD